MNQQQQDQRPPQSRRRGAVMIIVLVLFAVTFAFAGIWAKRLLAEHRGQRRSEERVQAAWLAEAGVRRAAAQLSADADYQGEEWPVDAKELNRAKPASVLISIQPGDSPGQVRLVARARYPREDAHVQATKTVVFTLPSTEPQP